jgi:Icc-related predicted phosphoesterase
MKILHISDTHSLHGLFPMSRFEGIDLVIHSGDCSNYMNPYKNKEEVLNFLEWYKNVPVANKIYVAGNHDTSIEKGLITKSDFTDNGIIYLENEGTDIEGLKIWGSPYTPSFNDWAFMKARHKLHSVWENIPNDTDVLITHGPPKGILDLSADAKHNLEMCGCSALRKRVEKMNLKAMCFGHIHNSEGITNQGTARIGGRDAIYSNAACVFDGRFDKGLTSYGNIINL